MKSSLNSNVRLPPIADIAANVCLLPIAGWTCVVQPGAMRGILIFVGALTGALGAILTTPARQVFSDGGFLNAALGLIVGAACGGLLASRLRGRSD